MVRRPRASLIDLGFSDSLEEYLSGVGSMKKKREWRADEELSEELVEELNEELSGSGMMKHMSLYHKSPSKAPGHFPCPKCLKTYTYKNNLMRHIRVECGKEPNHFCPFCMYKCKHKADLLRHVRNKHEVNLEKAEVQSAIALQ
ncbi:uncharacterized protein [Bemisia tabaci]|uniref:uncharacterized protein n=1 Tax=Bemisia tabaci TaxID=7038 RepID=UPI003B280F38